MTDRPPRLRSRLRLWWPFAAVLGVGLTTATLGSRMLLGGVVMALAFLMAAAVRAWLPDDVAGGLRIRGRTADVVGYLAAAVLVLGAVLAVDLGPVRR